MSCCVTVCLALRGTRVKGERSQVRSRRSALGRPKRGRWSGGQAAESPCSDYSPQGEGFLTWDQAAAIVREPDTVSLQCWSYRILPPDQRTEVLRIKKR